MGIRMDDVVSCSRTVLPIPTLFRGGTVTGSAYLPDKGNSAASKIDVMLEKY